MELPIYYDDDDDDINYSHTYYSYAYDDTNVVHDVER